MARGYTRRQRCSPCCLFVRTPRPCSRAHSCSCARPLKRVSARCHQNAIRQKTNAQNYLRLSSRVDAVASRLESAIKMQQVTKSMGKVVNGMDKVLGSMNVEQISKVMENFERSFEDMDVRSGYVEQVCLSSDQAPLVYEGVAMLTVAPRLRR